MYLYIYIYIEGSFKKLLASATKKTLGKHFFVLSCSSKSNSLCHLSKKRAVGHLLFPFIIFTVYYFTLYFVKIVF